MRTARAIRRRAIAGISVAAFASGAEGIHAAEIDEIIVKARKRDELLQESPLAVSALPGTLLDEARAWDVFDVAELVPSLDVAQSTGPLSTSFYVRRIGNLGNIPNFESAVGLFVDGAFRSRSGTGIGDLFDIQQIEVIRGPQTTLYGKNTTAGVIGISTNPPNSEFSIDGAVTAGWIEGPDTAHSRRLEVVVNGPLAGSLSGRAGLLYYGHDETFINLFNGDDSQNAKRYTLRGKLRYNPGSNIDARLTVNRFRVDSARLGDLLLFEGNAIRNANEFFGVPCPEHPPDERYFCRNEASILDLTSDNISLDLQIEAGGLNFYSVSNVERYEADRTFDADQLDIDVVGISDQQEGGNFSQEFRVSGPEDVGASWLAGAFYFDGSLDRGGLARPTFVLGPDAPALGAMLGIPLGEPGDSGYVVSNSETRHLSLFGSVEWPVTTAWSLTAGVRWQDEDQSSTIDNFADHNRPTIVTQRLVPEFANAALSRGMHGWSWDLVARYRWNRTAMGYVQYAEGLKSGGFNGGSGRTAPEDREFDDESVRSFELGYKTLLLDDRLRLSASIFSARYRDLQSAGWVSLRFLVNNAERVELSGLELDLETALGDGLGLSTSVSYVDAKYKRYANGACAFGKLPDNADGSACDLTGHRMPLAPRTRAHVGLFYERPVHTGAVFGRADWSWTSEYFTNASLDTRHVQDAYSLVNLRFGYRFDRFEVAAWIRNLTDEFVVLQEGPSNLFAMDPAYARFVAMPRSFGLTLSARM